jgi:glutathione S-transferase
MLKIYSYPQTRGLRVVWACKELGIEYDYKLVNLYKGEHKQADYLALTPSGKVPLIVDENRDDGERVVIAESGAILTYLADKQGRLIPKQNSSLRAQYEEMMYFLLTELEQPLWTLAKHDFALPEDKRISQVSETAKWEFAKALKVFSKMLADKPYVLGEEFSVADIIAGQIMSWAKGSKLDLLHDNVNAYADRVLNRQGLIAAKTHEKAIKDAI